MLVKSPAKINLTLDVKGKLDSGFHLLSTVMAQIPLDDELKFEFLDDDKIIIEGDLSEGSKWGGGIAKEDNLIYKAGKLLQQELGVKGRGFICEVKKNIPSQSGLGGGSSNAATTLMILNKIWELGLKKKELIELGRKIGTDIPFFISTAGENGAGKVVFEKNHGQKDEVLIQKRFPSLPSCGLLVIVPQKVRISTKKAFGAGNFSFSDPDDFEKEAMLKIALSEKNLSLAARTMSNAFQKSLFEKKEIYRQIEQTLKKTAALNLTLSGSGAAVYSFFETTKELQIAQKLLARSVGKIQIYALEI